MPAAWKLTRPLTSWRFNSVNIKSFGLVSNYLLKPIYSRWRRRNWSTYMSIAQLVLPGTCSKYIRIRNTRPHQYGPAQRACTGFQRSKQVVMLTRKARKSAYVACISTLRPLFYGIKFYTTSSILLIWWEERRREFYGMREEFCPYSYAVLSFDNCAIKVWTETTLKISTRATCIWWAP
jgi:hypothetical protein